MARDNYSLKNHELNPMAKWIVFILFALMSGILGYWVGVNSEMDLTTSTTTMSVPSTTVAPSATTQTNEPTTPSVTTPATN